MTLFISQLVFADLHYCCRKTNPDAPAIVFPEVLKGCGLTGGIAGEKSNLILCQQNVKCAFVCDAETCSKLSSSSHWQLPKKDRTDLIHRVAKGMMGQCDDSKLYWNDGIASCFGYFDLENDQKRYHCQGLDTCIGQTLALTTTAHDDAHPNIRQPDPGPNPWLIRPGIDSSVSPAR